MNKNPIVSAVMDWRNGNSQSFLICLDIFWDSWPYIQPLRKRQTGCFSMNYWFALHIPHIWLANSLECFFTFSFFSLPSFSVSGRVSRTNIRNHTNTYVPSLQYIFKTCPLNNNDDVLPFLWVNLIQFKTSKYFYNEVGILSETSGFWKWQITVVITTSNN